MSKSPPFASKFAHKAILLVLVPLILQTGFYFYLKKQLYESQVKAEQLDLANRLVSGANIYLLNMGYIIEAFIQSCARRDAAAEANLARVQHLADQDVERLSALLRQDKHDMEAGAFERLNKSVLGKINDEVVRLRSTSPAALLDDQLEDDFGRVADVRKACTRIAHREQDLALTTAKQEEEARNRFKQFVDLGAFSAIPLAAVVAFLIIRGTISQLAILKKNCQLLAEDKPLLPRLDSTDEVADVDRVFHGLAEALRMAAAHERRLLSELQFNEERVKSVIEALPVAVLVTDAKGNVESLNATAEKLFAHVQPAAIGADIGRLFTGNSATALAGDDAMQRLRTETEKRSLQMQAVPASGEPIAVEMSVTGFELSGNQRYVATILDITERQKIENLKRQFVAMVSHDIRAPLKSIRSSMEAIRSGHAGAVADSVKEQLASAEGNASRLLQMVESLLDLERLEAGLVEIASAQFDVSDLFNIAVPLVADYARQKDVKLEIQSTSLKAVGDIDALAQVLMNFLSNAIRYSPAGSTVKVTAKEQSGQIEVSVIDQGEGVPKRLQQEIFERYKQGRQRDKQKGFGLGLAICKSIVQQHGKEIGVESESGKGSRFWFTVSADSQAGL